MFTHQIIPLFKIAVKHHEFHTVDYLLVELYEWLHGPDLKIAKDACDIASMLIDAIENDESVPKKYLEDVKLIHRYASITIKYLEKDVSES